MIGERMRLSMFGTTVATQLVLLLVASSAIASQPHPKGVFASFSDCPVSDPAVYLCMVANITGGELLFGNKAVPINKTITLQGGLVATGQNAYTLTAAQDGHTLSRTALSVPGGLLGLGGSRSVTEATVTPEIAGAVSAIELDIGAATVEVGTALRLPLRAKVSSLTLGSNCYVGSAASPVVLDLTTGTTSPPTPNKPIKGGFGELEERTEGEWSALVVPSASLLDNAFAVPAVRGCNSSFYSSLASLDIGLPSRAGRNTAILHAKLELARAEAVRASE